MAVSKQVRADAAVEGVSAGLTGAIAGAKIGAAAGAAGGPIGALGGALIGAGVAGVSMYLASRQAGKTAEEDLKKVQKEQERMDRRAATEQRQLSRELAAQGQKGKTPMFEPPSSIMMEAVGGGSGFDAWHNRTFS